jgi:hypothetical protein
MSIAVQEVDSGGTQSVSLSSEGALRVKAHHNVFIHPVRDRHDP